MHIRLLPFVAAVAVILNSAVALADVSLAKVIGEHMVLQQNRSVPIWGKATPGEQIKVSFKNTGTTTHTVADDAGNWKVSIDSGPATSTPQFLRIAARNVIELNDVLVGEVWICSGQSNMAYPLNRRQLGRRLPDPPAGTYDVAAHEVRTANNPEIRILRVETNLKAPDLPTDGWHTAKGDQASSFSAVGYFFGKEINTELGVPVGLIQTAWGGSRIEPWTPSGAYDSYPGLKADAETSPSSPIGNYYEKLVAPLAPFSARGVLWYQGESNVITRNDGMRYYEKFRVLVNSWRADWHNPEMTFIQVQLAPHLYSKRPADPIPHTTASLAELWEAQLAGTQIPHVGMVVTTDLVWQKGNIHPPNKWDVGRRLALWALANDYGRKDIEFSGPLFKSVEYRDGKAVISFDHAQGLRSSDGNPLSEFTIAGDDKHFGPAEAVIEGNTVVVSSPRVSAPTAVRFAWDEGAQPNFTNSTGIPAAAFQTK